MSGNRSAGLGIFERVEINASADVVWRILLDVESYAQLFRTCSGVQNLNPRRALSPIEPGAKYLEKRRFQGRKFDFVTSATRVQEYNEVDDERRIFAVATSLYQSTGTATHTLEAVDSSNSRLAISYGMVPNGWYGKIYLWMFREKLNQDGYSAIVSDLGDIKQAAESGKYYASGSIAQRSDSTSASNLTGKTTISLQ